jgi:hypothetical protein
MSKDFDGGISTDKRKLLKAALTSQKSAIGKLLTALESEKSASSAAKARLQPTKNLPKLKQRKVTGVNRQTDALERAIGEATKKGRLIRDVEHIQKGVNLFTTRVVRLTAVVRNL